MQRFSYPYAFVCPRRERSSTELDRPCRHSRGIGSADARILSSFGIFRM